MTARRRGAKREPEAVRASTTPTISMLWRRLDVPGHDACRLSRDGEGWALRGVAAFVHEGAPARLDYGVRCDDAWRTLDGHVEGWLGATGIALRVARAPDGAWRLNDRVVAGLDDCVDVDFGFTPATNVLQLRRIALAVGDGADVPVAWVDAAGGALRRLEQRYEHVSGEGVGGWYGYSAPAFDYQARLDVGASGFVRDYPRLWVAEATA